MSHRKALYKEEVIDFTKCSSMQTWNTGNFLQKPSKLWDMGLGTFDLHFHNNSIPIPSENSYSVSTTTQSLTQSSASAPFTYGDYKQIRGMIGLEAVSRNSHDFPSVNAEIDVVNAIPEENTLLRKKIELQQQQIEKQRLQIEEQGNQIKLLQKQMYRGRDVERRGQRQTTPQIDPIVLDQRKRDQERFNGIAKKLEDYNPYNRPLNRHHHLQDRSRSRFSSNRYSRSKSRSRSRSRERGKSSRDNHSYNRSSASNRRNSRDWNSDKRYGLNQQRDSNHNFSHQKDNFKRSSSSKDSYSHNASPPKKFLKVESSKCKDDWDFDQKDEEADPWIEHNNADMDKCLEDWFDRNKQLEKKFSSRYSHETSYQDSSIYQDRCNRDKSSKKPDRSEDSKYPKFVKEKSPDKTFTAKKIEVKSDSAYSGVLSYCAMEKKTKSTDKPKKSESKSLFIPILPKDSSKPKAKDSSKLKVHKKPKVSRWSSATLDSVKVAIKKSSDSEAEEFRGFTVKDCNLSPKSIIKSFFMKKQQADLTKIKEESDKTTEVSDKEPVESLKVEEPVKQPENIKTEETREAEDSQNVVVEKEPDAPKIVDPELLSIAMTEEEFVMFLKKTSPEADRGQIQSKECTEKSTLDKEDIDMENLDDPWTRHSSLMIVNNDKLTDNPPGTD